MANSENPTPDSPDGKPDPNRKSPGSSKRPERPQSGNLFWYLLIGMLITLVVFSFVGKQNKGEELKFSEFYNGLARPDSANSDARFNKTNVFELTIGVDEINFQDQPKPEEGSTRDTEKTIKYFYIASVGLGDDSQADLTARLDTSKIAYTFDKMPPEWQSLAYLFIFPFLLIIFFLFIFRRMGGAGSAMSFGRSRGRLFAQEDIEINFNDVAGIEEAVEELREVVEFLRTPAKYQALGGRIPRGVLLVGPPGTGKTLLAKAVAGEADVPFYSLSGSDFVEMFVGVGAARVRDMFQQAGQRSPSIIFIDELDALGKVRGSGMPGGHDEREQTLNALLVEMDGFSSDQSVIVMAATNRPETLDPALMRPGRFDRHVMVDRPDIKGREAILKVHSAKIKMDDSVDLQRIAKLSPGFVGADLANLVNEAALLAARNDKTKVTMHEFEEGIERVMAGLEKQTRLIHQDEKQRVAYHECGHALVACSLPHTDPVHKISIIPRGMGALGYMLQLPSDERQLVTQTEIENRICVCLGGTVTEEIVYNEISTGAQNDLQRATEFARRMVTEFGMSPKLGRVHYSDSKRSPFLGVQTAPSDPIHSEDTIREIDLEIKRIIEEASQTVHEVLVNRREVLDHMARELVETETMDSDHLNRILDQYKTGPQIKPGTSAASPKESVDTSAPASDDDLQARDAVDGA